MGVLTKAIGKGATYNKWESRNSIAKLCKPFQKKQVIADQITSSQLPLTKSSIAPVLPPLFVSWWEKLLELCEGISDTGKEEGKGLDVGGSGPAFLRTLFLLPGCLISVGGLKARRYCKNTLVGAKWINKFSHCQAFRQQKWGSRSCPHKEYSVVQGRKSK